MSGPTEELSEARNLGDDDLAAAIDPAQLMTAHCGAQSCDADRFQGVYDAYQNTGVRMVLAAVLESRTLSGSRPWCDPH